MKEGRREWWLTGGLRVGAAEGRGHIDTVDSTVALRWLVVYNLVASA
jgi:hypothetical protein